MGCPHPCVICPRMPCTLVNAHLLVVGLPWGFNFQILLLSPPADQSFNRIKKIAGIDRTNFNNNATQISPVLFISKYLIVVADNRALSDEKCDFLEQQRKMKSVRNHTLMPWRGEGKCMNSHATITRGAT